MLVAVFILGRLSSSDFNLNSFLNSLSLFTFCGVTFNGSLFFSSLGGTRESGGCCWWWLGGCLLEMVVFRGTGD